jgi:competence protein ComEC
VLRLVPAARTAARGLLDRQWRARQSVEARAAVRAIAVYPPDLRMVPAGAAAWAAAWVGTSETVAGLAVAATGVVVGVTVAVLRRSALMASIAVVIAVSAGVGLLDVHRLRHGPVALLAGREAAVSAEIETRSDPHLVATDGPVDRAPVMKAAVVKAATVRLDGRGGMWRVRVPVLLVVSGPQLEKWLQTPVGSRVQVDGRLQSPNPASDVAAVLRVHSAPVVVRPPSGGLRLVEQVRAGLRRSVADRRPEPRALVPALVLGDTSALDTALTDNFKSTGLTHLTAVSGANLTLLLAFLLTVARWIGLRGWNLRIVGLAGVIIFVALCRTEPSVLRAAAMGLVALAALGSGSRAAGVRNLAVASLVLLLLDPFLSRSVGFTLSVLACAGIVWWARRWAMIINRWLPLVFAESIAVPLAAQLATTPVVAAISGRVSMSGLVANALAGPFVGPATVLGFAAAGASLVSAALAAVFGLVPPGRRR